MSLDAPCGGFYAVGVCAYLSRANSKHVIHLRKSCDTSDWTSIAVILVCAWSFRGEWILSGQDHDLSDFIVLRLILSHDSIVVLYLTHLFHNFYCASSCSIVSPTLLCCFENSLLDRFKVNFIAMHKKILFHRFHCAAHDSLLFIDFIVLYMILLFSSILLRCI